MERRNEHAEGGDAGHARKWAMGKNAGQAREGAVEKDTGHARKGAMGENGGQERCRCVVWKRCDGRVGRARERRGGIGIWEEERGQGKERWDRDLGESKGQGGERWDRELGGRKGPGQEAGEGEGRRRGMMMSADGWALGCFIGLHKSLNMLQSDSKAGRAGRAVEGTVRWAREELRERQDSQ
eukprot:361747-Chlamydomonas_euryale.AAC.9